MDISAIGASATHIVEKQAQSLPIDDDKITKADIFADQIATPQLQAPKTVETEDNLVTSVVDSLRDMQGDFRHVMGGLMSDRSRDATFGGAAHSASFGDQAKAVFEMRPGAGSAPNVSGLPADLGDNAKLMYSMTRELIGTQIDVTRVVVSEQMFSTTAGKVQKSTDMLLRGQ